jgi:glyoxylase-like metal-dependent hydrolase (beta-lactamase superfamily II)
MRAHFVTPVAYQIHTLWTVGSYAYLLKGPEGLALVDAGLWRNGAPILRALRRLGRDDLRLIFLTHAHVDHYGSAAAIRRATGAPIAIHHADRDALAQGATPLRAAPHGLGRWLPLLFE